jgi:hypothetical protein
MNRPDQPVAAPVVAAPVVAAPVVAAPVVVPARPSAADAESVRIFEAEVRSAVSYEKGLAVKALIALAVVALVVTIRMLFLG